jgi:GAF domain-containing protein
MLARHHQLKVGEVGIVGYVTGHKESRIAMDVGLDAVYFDNPDLPDTRSEMALPLVVGERVLGALDVQSTEPGAFTQEDIATLQILADQVAVAIDNARLFSENQAALEAMQRAYGELSREAWAKILHDQPELKVLANQYDILYTPTKRWTPEMLQAAQSGELVRSDEQTVAIPIQERGNILGILRLRKPDDHPWSKEELSLVETLAQQLFLALENARLYSETQRRAERERLASNIVASMRTSNDPEAIFQTALQELRQALLIKSREQLPQAPALPENGKSKGG